MKRRISKRTLLIGPPILLVSLVAVILAFGRPTKSTDQAVAKPISTTSKSVINYGPPTESEKREAEQHKEDLVNQGQTPGQPSTDGKKQVVVKISSDPSPQGPGVTVSGFAEGVLEDGGTCTATFTKGGERQVVTSKGTADASTTSCPPMTAQLATGSWQLVLTYSSTTAVGSSTETLAVK